MSEFLFSTAEARSVRPLPTLLPACEHCGLYKGCRSPKMKPDGEGRRGILLVSEYPGAEEDRQGRPLVGGMGRYLAGLLSRFDVDMRRDCWLTNAQICYTEHPIKHPSVVEDCRPNLLNTIQKLDPDVIVLLGGSAIRSLLTHVWGQEAGSVERWNGALIPAHKPNAWICPTYNPAHLMRQDQVDPVKSGLLIQQLRMALSQRGKPWPEGPPDYAKQVEILVDPEQAADRLARYTSGLIAFDYETTSLKPEGPHSEIVCASVCWNGTETIAFPWHGPVRDAMKTLLTNRDVGKIGFNAKFEDRWTRCHLGIDVLGWSWCGMLGAHAIRPVKGTTGLAFQAFARLGQPYYSHHLDPLLDSDKKGGYAPNRAREIKLTLLLKYCGLDSLLEYKVAIAQAWELGIDLENG